MEERIRQRRAVYTVLQEWLDESSVLTALQIFEDDYQGKPAVAINDYLRRIAPLYKDKVDAKTLRRSLMALLVRHSQDLAPDPLPQLERLRSGQVSKKSTDFTLQPSTEQLALHNLVSGMMRKISSAQRKVLHIQMARQLKLRFVNGSHDLLAQYLLSDNPQHLAGFDDRTLRDFFSLIYVASCDALGPVNADRWFAGAIAQVRQQDAAMGAALNRYL